MMIINTKQIVSMTEANQNFSKVARLADAQGNAVIFKNNRPKYLVIDLAQETFLNLTDAEKIEIVARRILEKHRKAFEALAK
ncbi:MAG TPA: type II toxin-antitoxin system Phd/YefM family antitoxin [Sphaerochaeta sp.]|jgi:antitoxin Phd|nr:type II toxin-antitoxin system Phd/YefM family antitoxin [Sphaerochaeta sp.]HOR79616.1 type II toxin-antitoxin system Phd/YefM family antitoxin [Sphaerochaeta sp.]HPK63374.1 type II toxin-antitoxin system Phd/YefM family antitoxin [Sphaerochaeta sp.]